MAHSSKDLFEFKELKIKSSTKVKSPLNINKKTITSLMSKPFFRILVVMKDESGKLKHIGYIGDFEDNYKVAIGIFENEIATIIQDHVDYLNYDVRIQTCGMIVFELKVKNTISKKNIDKMLRNY